MKQTSGKGHTAKHSQSRKHGQTSKHHPKHPPSRQRGVTVTPPHVIAGQPGPAKPRKLSIGDVACCSAEALAASLRLAGHLVDDSDVLALYWSTARDPDAGASILATLQAAAAAGLAGAFPSGIRPVRLGEPLLDQAPLPAGQRPGHWLDPDLSEIDHDLGGGPLDGLAHGLILGVELPGGPHALAVDPAGRAWSWGQPWPLAGFADAVVEEAWAVSWS